jgi:hypothetical protein
LLTKTYQPIVVHKHRWMQAKVVAKDINEVTGQPFEEID